jgi:hypothetical protein
MANVPIPGFRYSQCHAVTKKCPEAGSVVQQVHKILSDIELLAGCTPAKVGENSEWTAIANNVRGRTKQTFVKV